MRDAAYRYAARGWPVFPCQPGGKRPATEHGCKDASTDPAAIARWWADGGPAYNVAIATGSPGPDVLDVDNKPGGSGWAAYNRLKHAGVLAGAFAVVRTRSGGMHVYYGGTSQPNAAHIGGTDLDFRGAGGYVLAPPSVVEGGRYELLEHRQPDGRTFRLSTARRILEPPPRPAGPRPGRGLHGTRALARWVGQLGNGERNNGLYWAACRAVEQGADLEPLVQAAMDAGLPETEARRTVASAERTAR